MKFDEISAFLARTKHEIFYHEPLNTCAEALAATERLKIPGQKCKNLFVQRKKPGRDIMYALIIAATDARVKLGKWRMSSDGPRILGISTGFGPLALLKTTAPVELIVHESVDRTGLVAVHGHSNAETVVMAVKDLPGL